MLWVGADDHNPPASRMTRAFITHFFDRRSDFHANWATLQAYYYNMAAQKID